ncbi:MAG: (Fe-S)-binding protein [Chloroflexi bacterium]|nr:(Fe-S)-binding protein [Chloroflexota bacterium]
MQSTTGTTSKTSGFTTAEAPREEDLYKCVHCGFCLNACPTYLATGLESESPRGRLAMMKAVHEGRLEIGPAVIPSWELCLQCRACEDACPSNVPYGSLMESVRLEIKTVGQRPRHARFARRVGFGILLQRPRLLRALATSIKLYQRSGMRRVVRAIGILRLLPGDQVVLEAYLPELRTKFFAASNQTATPPASERKAKVALLAGCVMPLMHGPTMEAAMRVLRRNGIEVIVPAGQACCGALNVHAGERETAREMARRNIDSFLELDIDAVITASGGCGTQMKDYGELLAGDPDYAEKAERLAGMTRDIHEYLVEVGFKPPQGFLDMTVTYQDACHLAHTQKITDQPRQLLNSIPGLKLVELPESSVCCGAGGTYALTSPEMSGYLRDRKVENVESTGAMVVASGNPGCVLQMSKGLEARGSSTQVKYVIDLLDEAYSREK